MIREPNPFLKMLRAHRGGDPTYAPLFGVLADASIGKAPFRHEAVYNETVEPFSRWHYHGEGSLADRASWSCDDDVSGSTFHQRTPRAFWLSLLLAGRDAKAYGVWVAQLSADASVPVFDPDTASEGSVLAALLTAFFCDEDVGDLSSRELGGHDLVVAAASLLDRARDAPSSADVDAFDLANIRERWRLRMARRSPAVFRSLQSMGVLESVARGSLLDVAASGLAPRSSWSRA